MTEVTAVILIDWLKIQGENSTPVNVASLGTGRTVSLPMTQESAFGLLVQFSSPGLIEVAVDFEQGNTRPTIEQTADPEFVVPEKAGVLIEKIEDSDIHFVAFNPVVTRFSRLLLTGSGVNDAGTQLTRAELTYVRI